MKRPSSSVQVGVITAAHGIKGYVKIRSYAKPPKAIFSYGTLTNAKGQPVTLTAKGGTDESLIAEIKGVTDRNQAELLRGTALYAEEDAMPDDAREKLVGITVTLKNGSEYGTIISVQNYGAGDIVEIRKTDGGNEMLPLEDRFITVKKGNATITPPDYLEAK